ncbi:MAG: hypothetical protein WCC30_07565 [Candidatus Dormiibacterota bacterium]
MDATTLAVLAIIVTVLVALATLVVAFQTRKLAGATVTLGTHAERQLAEMELSRKLDWAPCLTYQPSHGGDSLVGGFSYTATVTNIGRGPALDCFFIRVLASTGKWAQSTQFDLGSGQQLEFTAREQPVPPPAFFGKEPGITTVLFCHEPSGACHVFGLADGRRQVSSSAADAPPWAVWYREQIALK